MSRAWHGAGEVGGRVLRASVECLEQCSGPAGATRAARRTRAPASPCSEGNPRSYASSSKDTATCLPVFRRQPTELREQLEGHDYLRYQLRMAGVRALETKVEPPIQRQKRTFGGSAVSLYYQGTKHKTTKVHYRSLRVPHYSVMHGFSMGPPLGIRPTRRPATTLKVSCSSTAFHKREDTVQKQFRGEPDDLRTAR